jgi:3-phosphoshikimate 1-carboxyvinyltransferase
LDRIDLCKAKSFKGEFYPPPDKSLSHRAVIFSSLSKGKNRIRNFLTAEDTISTLNAFRKLGVEIQNNLIPTPPPSVKGGWGGFSGELIINGRGLYGLKEPFDVIDCRNSGTTMRLLPGVLSGNPFFSILTGDESLKRRPMSRVIVPLRQMGAEIMARLEDKYPPIAIRGRRLKAIKYTLPVASAQVKSAILLAGLYAEGETEVIEPFKSRDHTERMLPSFGARITIEGLHIKIKGGTELEGLEIQVPGDFSSAAFFIVGALLVKDSEIIIREVGVNPTRTGLLAVLKEMGGYIEISNMKYVSGEPVADLYCRGGKELKAIHITSDKMPALIDEFPVLCVAATYATGITTIKGAEELRVKESDRIKAMATELRKMGAEIEEFEDGLSITGKRVLKGTLVESYNDHRIAMALSIAALIADGTTTISDFSSVNISFPGFLNILKKLTT